MPKKFTNRGPFPFMPRKDAMIVLNTKIRTLYSMNWSMAEIAGLLNVSKTTVHKALKGRSAPLTVEEKTLKLQ